MPENNNNEIVVAEVVENQMPILANRQAVMANLMAQADIAGNISNKEAIKMVAEAIEAKVAVTPTDQLTIADAFALRAARGAKNSNTAGEEIANLLRQNGLME